MCALLPAWMCLLLGLLCLEIQSRTLTLQNLSHRHRFSSPETSKYHKSSYSTTMPTQSDLAVAIDNSITQGNTNIIWRALLHREPPPRLSELLLDQSETPIGRQRSRGRRHVINGGGRSHGHLMRVGCVLGTCQVQNLSHRLYQLIGQSGREDSSPINPRSPHSFG